jgi:sRNA-binding protein
MALPAWAAVTVQIPAETRVTVVPLTLHTVDGAAVKVTARPEDAVALSVTGDWARVFLANAAKLIVWATLTMIVC